MYHELSRERATSVCPLPGRPVRTKARVPAPGQHPSGNGMSSSDAGVPDLGEKTSPGKCLPLLDFGTVQHHRCYPREGSPGAAMPHISHPVPLRFWEKTIIKIRTNKQRMSRVGEQCEACREGCEGAHIGLSHAQPHHH